jgi:hypothetical protein
MEKNLYQEILIRYNTIKKIPFLLLRKIKKTKLKKLSDSEKEKVLEWIVEFEKGPLKRYMSLWRERTQEQWEWFEHLCPDAREYIRLKNLRSIMRKKWDSTMPQEIKYDREKDEKNTYEKTA